MKIDELKTVAVIGAGDMGHGIAEVALLAGYEVYLYDIGLDQVSAGVERIRASVDKLVSKGKVEASLRDRINFALLKSTVDLKEAVQSAGLVVEAAPEKMDLKKEIFRIAGVFSPAGAVLASNTSSMSITEISEASSRPRDFLGLHYFNPAVLMKLVEVIKGGHTTEETMQFGMDFIKKTGKIPVRVNKDVPGFIVNRVQAPAGVLLGCIVDHNVASPEEVDAVLRKMGLPMGPFETMDFAGLDIGYHTGLYYAEKVHPDFGPSRAIREKVEKGELGKKTGRGFFDWSKGRPQIDTAKACERFDPLDLIAVNANEATKLIEEGVCALEDVETAIINGTGNPLGLFGLIRTQPPEALVQRLEGLARWYNKEIFKPTRTIREGKYQ